MNTLIFIFTFLVLLLHVNEAKHTNTCPPIKCQNDSNLINIQFPFKVQDFQPHNNHCGLSGFELSCNQNRTIVHFPFYGDLIVKSISYDLKKLDLIDPNNCVHQVFLNLNLSHTPFSYYYTLKEYKYLNCSSQLSDQSFLQVPCLSGFDHHVYVVETSFVVPDSCKHVKTVRIPFSYSPYLSDNSFGLGLTWGLANFQDSEATKVTSTDQQEAGHHQEFMEIKDDKVLACFMVILIVVMLFYIKKVHYSKKVDLKEEAFHGNAILGDYEALKPKRESMANV